MYFDSHAHYDDEAFDADRDELIPLLHGSGVELIMNAGSNGDSSAASVALANRYPFVYAAVGWHPENAEEFDAASPEAVRRWCADPKVRAVGEIGLDYHYDTPERELQKKVLRAQMALAEELNKPVIIHDRDAHGDSMEIVREFRNVRGVFHCFSGSAEMAAELIRLGWYIGFTGAITFKNARKAIETLEIVPEDRILIETDCPYLAPVPNRGKRNDSRNLVYVAERIAEVRGRSVEEIAAASMKNARTLYGIE